MLAKFPIIEDIKIDSFKTMNDFTSLYEPYSDFNFASLYSYSNEIPNKISLLNGNLVIILHDYHTGAPFLSFLGERSIENTIQELLNYSQAHNMGSKLHMVPEISLLPQLNSESSKFKYLEERDNFDYIYEIKEMIELEGNKNHVNRRQVAMFRNNYPDIEFQQIDLKYPHNRKQIMELFDLWVAQAKRTADEANTEKVAIKRFMDLDTSINLVAFGLYDHGKLICFMFYEKLPNDFVLAHFGKANKEYAGLYRFAQNESCKYLFEQGSKFLNLEQDLGIESLRQTKMLWRPSRFLKKYSVEE